ncbi:hypothetical protein DUI87_07444 [Hirundo rustica rustica]|uniref:Uncharacterized protein n=1 Tax=Hirundo rustica rustica TaxID=333673 RepID=A0A3M0KQ93_HIRRU|nr:hypothetical protein DUI87_07444 [Hirundo rustica rustica]
MAAGGGAGEPGSVGAVAPEWRCRRLRLGRRQWRLLLEGAVRVEVKRLLTWGGVELGVESSLGWSPWGGLDVGKDSKLIAEQLLKSILTGTGNSKMLEVKQTKQKAGLAKWGSFGDKESGEVLEVPVDWKLVNIVPVFKKGKKNDPGSYHLKTHFSTWTLLDEMSSPQLDKHWIGEQLAPELGTKGYSERDDVRLTCC